MPDGARTRGQLRQPRIAEVVASVLRERIVDGVLVDGDVLPKQAWNKLSVETLRAYSSAITTSYLGRCVYF